MNPPCKASDAGRDRDEDLQADTQTTECAGTANEHLSLAGALHGYGIANFYSLIIPKIGAKEIVSVCI